jgi:MFS family permease
VSAAPTPGAEREATAPRDEKFNFAVLVGDVACFFIGFAFLDSSTALPALVDRLGGTATFLGLLGAIRQGGYFLPQLFVAHRIQGRTRYLPFLLRVAFTGRFCILLAAFVVFAFGARFPALALGALGLAWCASWVADGMGGVPWTAIVGKVVPAERRGRLFATTQIVSGVGRLLVAGAVGALLAGRVAPFPISHGLLVLGCAVFIGLSWVFLALIREPPGEVAIEDPEARGGFGTFLRELPQRFRERPAFARLTLIQILASVGTATMPFLIGYAETRNVVTEIPGWLLDRFPSLQSGGLPGLFLAQQTVGLLLLAPIWGMVSDRQGPRKTLMAILGMSLISPLMILAGCVVRGAELPLFLVAYFCFGAAQDGWVIITNYLLEAVPAEEQPTYIGLLNAGSAPALLLPLIAGVIVNTSGAPAVFVFAAILILIGYLFARSLPDTRRA